MLKLSFTDLAYKTKQDCNPAAVSMALKLPEAVREIDDTEFLKLVGEEGYSWSGGIFDGERDIDHWKEQQVFALDFDNKDEEHSVSLDDVISRCEEYNVLPFGAYRTLSSETRDDKYRLLFKLEESISHPKIAKLIVVLLYYLFLESDSACREIARLYYGGKEITYENQSNYLNIINLLSGCKEYNTDLGIYDDIQKKINNEAENPVIDPNVDSRKTIFEDYDANTETPEEAELRRIRNKDKINRTLTIDGDTYFFDFVEKLPTPQTEKKNNKSSANNDSNQFLGFQDRMKLKSALDAIKYDKKAITYEIRRNIIWGIRNTFGDETWDMIYEWAMREKAPGAYKRGPKYIWDDFNIDKSVKPTVGSVYGIAKEHYDWEYKDKLVKSMNKRYFVAPMGTRTYIHTYGREKMDDGSYFKVLKQLGVQDFINLKKNKKTKVKNTAGSGDKKQDVGSYWFNHDERLTYEEGITFDPKGDVPAGYYNMWKGMPVKPCDYDIKDVDDSLFYLFWDHLLNNVCHRDREIFEYVIKWMSYSVQYPWKKTKVAVVFRGAKGVGKTIIGRLFGSIFGPYFKTVTNESHLTGKHNMHLMNCVFLLADEANWGGNKATDNILKNLITEDTIIIEPKNVNAFTATNYLHIMMATNNEWVVPATKDERRYCVLDVGEGRKQDTKYFTAMWNDMIEYGGNREFLKFLLNINLDSFDHMKYPKTEAMYDQVLASLTPIGMFWKNRLEEGVLDQVNGNWGVVRFDQLHEDYIEYMKKIQSGRKYKSDEGQFAKELNELIPDIGITKYPKRLRKWVTIEDRKGVQQKVQRKFYEMPSLDECRYHFERVYFGGFKYKWESVQDDNSDRSLKVESEMLNENTDETVSGHDIILENSKETSFDLGDGKTISF